MSFSVQAETVEQKEARLRKELAEVEKEIAVQQQFVAQAKQQTASIERDIAILDAQIREANLKIQAKQISIEQLGKDIGAKTQTIGELEEKIVRGKQSLSQIIRKTNEKDNISLVEVVLSNQDFSAFFEDVSSFDAIERSMQLSFEEIRGTKHATENEREELSDRQNAELNAKKVIEDERRHVQSLEAEKQKLLAISKTTEKTYEMILAERQQKAAQIRAALFALRDTAAIPFGDALKYAEEAERATGVRPAFLLAILTQESNLGANVGTCNRPGDPPEKLWYNIMPGPKDNSWRDDQTIFLQIMKELGRSPEGTPLSCPLSSGGWGGAMGPSQFIPTTWNSYKSRLATYLKKKVPDPWNPRDAFMASAIYLSDLGAGAKTYTAEQTAALKYYAGGNWSKPQNAFYGHQVMGHAQRIQETMIDPLKNL